MAGYPPVDKSTASRGIPGVRRVGIEVKDGTTAGWSRNQPRVIGTAALTQELQQIVMMLLIVWLVGVIGYRRGIPVRTRSL